MPAHDDLSQVALAISAFHSDDAVIALLRHVFAQGQQFGAVIVVDSLGTGAIAAEAHSQGWPLHYVNAPTNLGSAGNLDRRLQTAASLGLRWCFALNHDGEINRERVISLVRQGGCRDRVGAVYPQLIFTSAGNRPDRPRRSFHSYGLLGDGRATDGGACHGGNCVKVAWSSSNGALYGLDAIRDGVHNLADLWMGYEDLVIGWEMQCRGWNQWLCRDVQQPDNYEYDPVRFFGREIYLANKPSWYMYYHIRNLWLIARHSDGAAVSHASVLRRLIVDIVLILLYRSAKMERLRFLFTGLIHGVRGVSGKSTVP